ncbi:MAG: hypothetical protein ACRDO8_03400 [Nocardioidaceae bacterium]
MTAFVLVCVAAVVALLGWVFVGRSRHRRPLGAAITVLTVLATVATVFGEPMGGDWQRTLVLLALVLAVCGGAVVTTAAFDHIDSADTGRGSAYTMESAGHVLRGGAWIGALERLAIFGTLAARWPEGVAVVLAVKGLGRYPELRNPVEVTGSPGSSGATERFIIGTMISMSWAALCIYLAFSPYVVGPSLR